MNDVYSRAIVCEGDAEEELFKRLIRDRDLPVFYIQNAKGRTGYEDALRGLRIGSQTRQLNGILIVRDNEDNPAQSFEDIQKQIRRATGYPVPVRAMEVAREIGQPAIMIMMLPWIDVPGCLESLLKPIYQREKESIKDCVDEFMKCTKVTEWEIQKRDKTAIQCFIAGSNHDDPNKSLKYLLKSDRNPLPMTAPELDNIANILKEFDATCSI